MEIRVSGVCIAPCNDLFARRIMEMQVLITELLGKFEFSPSEEGLELLHLRAPQILIPAVKGRIHEGEQVPLRVALLSKE